MDSDSNTPEISDSALNRLGDDVLIDILARLTCKSATRFKLVCKHWKTLISSDYFIKLSTHFLHNSSDSSSHKLIFQLNRYRSSEYQHTLIVPCESSTNRVLQRLDLGFLPRRPVSRIAVRASCADLILCSFVENYLSLEKNFYVCNPRTREWIALPAVRLRVHDYVAGLLCIPAPCSLCHTQAVVSSRCKFTVMRICSYNKHLSQLEVELFSSEEGQWRSHFLSFPHKIDHQRGNIVPYKGMLHWLNYPYVLVFDPFNAPGKISRVIDVEPNIGSARIYNIGVCCGRLRVSYSTVFLLSDAHHYILELKDYDMGKWSLVHKLKSVDYRSFGAYVDPDGNFVTKLSNNSSVWLSNLLTTKDAIDLKYELIVHDGQDLDLLGMNVHHIDYNCWPTPVPSLSLS